MKYPQLLTEYIVALGHLSTLHPAMEIDVNDPERMAKEIYDHVQQELQNDYKKGFNAGMDYEMECD